MSKLTIFLLHGMRKIVQFLKSKFYIGLVSAMVLIPNMYVVILGIEDFPFTCAPMFAHYIGPETALYIFKFDGVKDQNKELITSDEYGKPEAVFIRQFFSKAYGSKDPVSAFGYHPEDNLDAFSLRMNRFFCLYWKYLSENKKKDYDKIELIVEKVDPSGKLLNSYLLGYFDVKKQQYFHFPQKLVEQ